MNPANPNKPLVLVVDDSALIRQRVCQLLREEILLTHYLEAPNGTDAWALFQFCNPQIVVLDLHLPDLHGFELLKRMKKAAPSCVVIILSQWADLVVREESLRLGADRFLNKASEFMHLPNAIKELAARLTS